jgi:hypothetical protein
MDPRDRTRRPALSPEIVAVLSAVVLWGLLGIGYLSGAATPAPTSSPSPSSGAIASTTRPNATVDGSLLVLIRSTNAQLLEHRKSLRTLLAAASLDTAEVAATVRQVNAAVTFAAGIADRIATQPGGRRIADALRAAYDPILAVAEDVNSLALANEPGYRAGAERLVELIGLVPDIDDLVSPTVVPASGSPSNAPSPTVQPTRTPAPTPTPKPTDTAVPSASPAATPVPSASENLLDNPGFETGRTPWEFVVGTGAAGSYEVTTEQPSSGKQAASLSLSSGAGPWSALSLRQGGLRLDNGITYHVSLWARSTGPRDIRVRVTTAVAEVIASRILSIDSTWRLVSFDVTAIGTVEGAVLVIETGISGQTVWLDDVGFGA